jgi:hypothetical protein
MNALPVSNPASNETDLWLAQTAPRSGVAPGPLFIMGGGEARTEIAGLRLATEVLAEDGE